AGTQLLDELGLLDEALALGARRMEGMVVHAPDGGRFTAHYSRVEPGRAALGLTRYQLDQLLLDRAEAVGVTVCERTHVRDVIQENGRVTGVSVSIDGARETLRA